MDLSKLKIGDVVNAFEEDGNLMVVIKTDNAGTQTHDEEAKAYHAVGNPVEALPKTHKLYKSVVDKFKLTIQ